MTLHDLIFRSAPLAGEGKDKIPWDDPEFSGRMLENHLSQGHDWASRRLDLIERHVGWITTALPRNRARILDLACGPGLYTHLLAGAGHDCVGVDFSPAAIAHATRRAEEDGLPIVYVREDIQRFHSDSPFDAILFTFGECNVFTTEDLAAILRNCAQMLRPGGLFALEAHTLEAVMAAGQAPPLWQSHTRGLFLPGPHLVLQENAWDGADLTAATRYYAVDESGDVQVFSATMQGYASDQYTGLLHEAGFQETRVLLPEEWPPGDPFAGKLVTLACRKA